jgi:hypothetical protein
MKVDLIKIYYFPFETVFNVVKFDEMEENYVQNLCSVIYI